MVLLKHPTTFVGLSPNYRGLFLPFFPSQMPNKRLSQEREMTKVTQGLNAKSTLLSSVCIKFFLESGTSGQNTNRCVTQIFQRLQHHKEGEFCSPSTSKPHSAGKKERKKSFVPKILVEEVEMSPNWDINNRAGCATKSQQVPAASPRHLPPTETKRPRTSHIAAFGDTKPRCHLQHPQELGTGLLLSQRVNPDLP